MLFQKSLLHNLRVRSGSATSQTLQQSSSNRSDRQSKSVHFTRRRLEEKKIQSENVNFGEEKKKSVDLKRKGKRVTSVFIYLEAVKVSDPNIFQGFPGFQRNDMKWCI